jgi:hypothetical protein
VILFNFKLTAPTELQQLRYHAGFGEKNSKGGNGGFSDLAIARMKADLQIRRYRIAEAALVS